MSLTARKTMEAQYATSTHLQTRIAFQAKYSRNPQGFGPWITAHYGLASGERVLELGCGTGSMWQGVTLPEGCHVTLTDYSAGMLETAKAATPHLQADYVQADAQQIPFADDAFDVVIANMMLYHVPDIHRALGEIRRVLRAGGRFYAATFGEHGATEAVLDMLGLPSQGNHRFTLQNGGGQLQPYFAQVCREDYPDAFDVTDLNDLTAYLRSMQQMSVLAEIPDAQLLAAFAPHVRGGVLTLPKEYGLFICR